MSKGVKVLAKNRRGGFDYDVKEKIFAGIVLLGPEVKSLKAGQASLSGSYITLLSGEAYLTGAHINPYGPAGGRGPEPTRSRKLLLRRTEIDRLIGEKKAGISAIPLAIVQQGPLIKLEIGLGRGRKTRDKREVIKKRDLEREMHRQA